ncbi:MAG: hypothetical protein ACI841_002370, partial [Planctomycetota bacterium]
HSAEGSLGAAVLGFELLDTVDEIASVVHGSSL